MSVNSNIGSPDEVERWQRKLTDATRQQRLVKTQEYVEERCRACQQALGRDTVKAILPRESIKSLESIIQKIWKKRSDTDTSGTLYDFDDIDDLIGIKLLCPYPSRAEKVCKWLCAQDYFALVKPDGNSEPIRPPCTSEDKLAELVENARVEYERGYRAYHLTVTPNWNKKWAGTRCEIQVKTLCQEAWDAMTHSTTYKGTSVIDQSLEDHTRKLSDVLNAVDEHGEIVRQQFKRFEAIDAERREIAARFTIWESKPVQKKLRLDNEVNLTSADPGSFSQEDINSLTLARDRYHEEGPSTAACFIAAFLALHEADRENLSTARLYIKEYLRDATAKDIPEVAAWDVAGVTYWAIEDLSLAVAYARRAVLEAEDQSLDNDLIRYCNNFCSYVAESLAMGLAIPSDWKRDAIKHGVRLQSHTPPEPEYLNTAGFIKIITANDAKSVEEGLPLLNRASEVASATEEGQSAEVTRGFAEMYRRLAYIRIADLRVRE